MTIRIGGESYALEFASLNDRFLAEKFENLPRAGFETEARILRNRPALFEAQARYELLKRAAELPDELPRHEVDQLAWRLGVTRTPPRNAQEVRKLAESMIPRVQDEITIFKAEIDTLIADLARIRATLAAHDYKYLTTYRYAMPAGEETRALVCRTLGHGVSKTEELLAAVSSKVFLLGPSNQQYLFLPKDTRKALLETKQRQPSKNAARPETPKPRPQIEYLTSLDEAESAMDGFYAYDWLSVEPLVRLFLSARDEDFQNVVKNGR